MSYEPQIGDIVRITKCCAGKHVGLVGKIDEIDRNCQREKYRVVTNEGTWICWAKAVEHVCPPAPEVFARAQHDCAKWRSNPAVYDEIMGKLLEIMALVHAERKAAREREQSEKKGEK